MSMFQSKKVIFFFNSEHCEVRHPGRLFSRNGKLSEFVLKILAFETAFVFLMRKRLCFDQPSCGARFSRPSAALCTNIQLRSEAQQHIIVIILRRELGINQVSMTHSTWQELVKILALPCHASSECRMSCVKACVRVRVKCRVSDRFILRLFAGANPLYRRAFTKGESEPWVFRGGLQGELQVRFPVPRHQTGIQTFGPLANPQPRKKKKEKNCEFDVVWFARREKKSETSL